MTQLLAIGGPVHGTWLDDNPYGYIKVPKSRKLQWISDFVAESILTEDRPYEIVTYRKVQFAYNDKAKNIYAVDGAQPDEIQEMLKSYLLGHFIQSNAGEE